MRDFDGELGGEDDECKAAARAAVAARGRDHEGGRDLNRRGDDLVGDAALVVVVRCESGDVTVPYF